MTNMPRWGKHTNEVIDIPRMDTPTNGVIDLLGSTVVVYFITLLARVYFVYDAYVLIIVACRCPMIFPPP